MIFKIIMLHIMMVSMLSAVMVAEYKMDEPVWNGTTGEVLDNVGSNNGTTKNGASIIAGVEGNAGSFDGVDDYVELANELSILRGTASLSVWIRTTQTGDDTMWRAPGITGVEDYGGGDDIFWGWIDASGHIGITVANDPAAKSTTLINDGRWHHAVFTRDEPNREVIVYIDGIEEARNSNATSGTIGNIFNSLGRIVKTKGQSPAYFKGDMDEVQIFDLVLTQSEVEDLYDKNRGKVVPEPTAEYRMDECYWLGSAYKDVMDSGVNALNGSSYNDAMIDKTTSAINFSGLFDGNGDYIDVDDDPKLEVTDKMSISFWVFPKQDTQDEYYIAKRENRKGWYIWFDNRGTDRIEFSLRIGSGWRDVRINKPNNWTNNPHFIAATYDGSQMRLSIDGLSATVDITGSITNTSNPMVIGQYNNAAYFRGNMDEVKIWNTALTTANIETIYTYETARKNYNGTTREPIICEASIAAHTWEYVGVPADLRTGSYTIADIFGDNMINAYGTDWRVYRRDYSDTNNSSEYTYLSTTSEVLDFGKGYLLGSSNAETWDVNDIVSVDYDSTSLDCTANRCVEIDVKSASLDADAGDDLLGEGSYRYNLSGFPGKSPVDWADCRFIIDGIVYTPSAAEAEGLVAKTIWQYNPGSGANSNGYTMCDDSLTTCRLEPYKAFWVELHGSTKDKTVKLLIPEE